MRKEGGPAKKHRNGNCTQRGSVLRKELRKYRHVWRCSEKCHSFVNGRCLKVLNASVYYAEAKSMCAEEGGSFVARITLEELAYLQLPWSEKFHFACFSLKKIVLTSHSILSWFVIITV